MASCCFANFPSHGKAVSRMRGLVNLAFLPQILNSGLLMKTFTHVNMSWVKTETPCMSGLSDLRRQRYIHVRASGTASVSKRVLHKYLMT